jgi:uncharacterized membrane protein YedE/YeeE
MEPFFCIGIFLGGMVAINFLANPEPVQINSKLAGELAGYGITDYSGIVPGQLFNWQNLLSVKVFMMIVLGGFMVGFGTRYAGGCTSGQFYHGSCNTSWPSLIATICFMIGGL